MNTASNDTRKISPRPFPRGLRCSCTSAFPKRGDNLKLTCAMSSRFSFLARFVSSRFRDFALRFARVLRQASSRFWDLIAWSSKIPWGNSTTLCFPLSLAPSSNLPIPCPLRWMNTWNCIRLHFQPAHPRSLPSVRSCRNSLPITTQL